MLRTLCGMDAQIDPKELKTLSDILALVLEEQAGPSEAALATIRRRARQDGTTGGALKNLFRQVAASGVPPRPASPPHAHAATQPPDMLRDALREMQRRYVEVGLQLDRECKETMRLRDKLALLERGPRATGPDRLHGKVGSMERQLRQMEELERRLGRTQFDLEAARAKLAADARLHARTDAQANMDVHAYAAAQVRAAAAERRDRLRRGCRRGLVLAGLLGWLAADQRISEPGPVAGCASPVGLDAGSPDIAL